MAGKKLPAGTSFKQQRLRACTPILTPAPVIATFFVIGVIFIPIGVVLLLESKDIIEVTKRYDRDCFLNEDFCNVTVDVTKRMKRPVYFYYGLSNYNQNHRRYVKSRDDSQLRGDRVKSISDVTTCSPYKSVNGSKDIDDLYLPCGLIARSFFNDTFVMYDPNDNPINWTIDGIAWQSDLNELFGNPPADQPGVPIIPECGANETDDCFFTNPDFVVWMRVAALPTFRKLHRIIHQDLLPGTYTFMINNTYPVSDFDGQKRLVLSTSSWIGGKNDFLGIAYLVVGSLSFVFAFLFLIKHKLSPRKFGDLSLIEWMDASYPHSSNPRT